MNLRLKSKLKFQSPNHIVERINDPKRNQNTGKLKTYEIEVKPAKQTRPPKQRKKVTQSYIYECKTYAVNQAKWKAADERCKDRKIEFKVVTERELGIHY